MTKFFDTRAAAVADLEAHGFRQIKNGNWVSDGIVACISPTRTGDTVAVRYWQNPNWSFSK